LVLSPARDLEGRTPKKMFLTISDLHAMEFFFKKKRVFFSVLCRKFFGR